MKSITYLILGKPSNLDDCLDISRKENLIDVSLDLTTLEEVTEMYVARQLIGMYNWKFENRDVGYIEIYEGLIAYETEERQRLSIDYANSRLENSLAKIEESGVDVIGRENKFDYSIAYSQIEWKKNILNLLKSMLIETEGKL